jgi:hypothetical protein
MQLDLAGQVAVVADGRGASGGHHPGLRAEDCLGSSPRRVSANVTGQAINVDGGCVMR